MVFSVRGRPADAISIKQRKPRPRRGFLFASPAASLIPLYFPDFISTVQHRLRLFLAGPFSLRVQRKGTKRKDTPMSWPDGCLRRDRALTGRAHAASRRVALIGTSLCRYPYRPASPQHDMKGMEHTGPSHETKDNRESYRRDHPPLMTLPSRCPVSRQASLDGWLSAHEPGTANRARPPETGQLRGHPLRGNVIRGCLFSW
jgi:hypothetical protein